METKLRLRSGYDPSAQDSISFHAARKKFLDGTDTPVAYLDRCIGTIEQREPALRAWVELNIERAREQAQASAQRYREGRACSPIDGMPIGIKDLIDTCDMPTQMGCEAYAGRVPQYDAPAVWALRRAGAIILGKTVTAELGMNEPGPTVNPYNPAHTPGGSSSGSAAAVAACMVPAALSTQVGGSIIRPASFCATYALKPTLGALNRGTGMALSQEVYGVHAGCPEDMWQVAFEIGQRVGGDFGYNGIIGPPGPIIPRKPQRLIVMETAAWKRLDPGSRLAFDHFLRQCLDHGIRLLRRSDHKLIESFEQAVHTLKIITDEINSYELLLTLRVQQKHRSEKLSPRLLSRLKQAESVTLDQYHLRLQQREETRYHFSRLAGLADAVVTLSSLGPAPTWSHEDGKDRSLNPTPTGDSSFNVQASALGAPAVSIPMLAVDGMPLGIQFLGQAGDDAKLCSLASWTSKNMEAVVMGTHT